MNIAEVKATKELSTRPSGTQNGEPGPSRVREIAETVKALNESGKLGSQSELRFTVDQKTGQPLIRIVDRVTDEIITQFPTESTLRAAEVLKNLQPGDHIA